MRLRRPDRLPESLPASLVVRGEALPLVVRRSRRARRLVLRVCAPTRSIRITLPARLPVAQALGFLESHSAWLERTVAERLVRPVPFLPGTVLCVADEPLRLVAAPVVRATRDGDRLQVPGTDPARFAARVTAYLRQQARRLITAEAEALSATVGRPVRCVRIGDPRSRWGSCSSVGVLSFSWRLILAPGFVRRAVVAHEVAHLVHHDHSPAFWAEATRLLGTSHAPARAWLAAHGVGLHALGRAAPAQGFGAGGEAGSLSTRSSHWSESGG